MKTYQMYIDGAWTDAAGKETFESKNPYTGALRVAAFDFFTGGSSAAVCTWDGDVWIVKNIEFDVQSYNNNHYSPQHPLVIYQTRRALPKGFADLFTILCRNNDIECRSLKGYTKGFDEQKEKKKKEASTTAKYGKNLKKHFKNGSIVKSLKNI